MLVEIRMFSDDAYVTRVV